MWSTWKVMQIGSKYTRTHTPSTCKLTLGGKFSWCGGENMFVAKSWIFDHLLKCESVSVSAKWLYVAHWKSATTKTRDFCAPLLTWLRVKQAISVQNNLNTVEDFEGNKRKYEKMNLSYLFRSSLVVWRGLVLGRVGFLVLEVPEALLHK